MPHRGDFEATRLPAKHAEKEDVAKAKKVRDFFKKAPPLIATLFAEELDFYSMYGTS